jgi:ABC-type multidrug transport system ATPase subunit
VSLIFTKKFSKLNGFGCLRVEAVRGVTFSIQKGQVFALLGHNGAGKTTTLNMLTGLLKPSSGDAILFGKSISYSLSDVQKFIGVCPQHDILWGELTAREHLEIFAELKKVPKEKRESEIEAKLKDVLLLDAADKHAGKYSGGMKRRLSVAISAIGNPSVIYLDEPTTGLDPQSRREIWGSIQRMKKDRVIILTSHSMEEADALGDRIGVMSHGKLKCIGTSLHLKNKFGLGYRLNLTCSPENQETLKECVNRMLPGCELIAETGVNFVFGVQTKNLPQLVPFFKFIEENSTSDHFFIKDWGLSQTTLEEVFLKVTKEDSHEVTIKSTK